MFEVFVEFLDRKGFFIVLLVGLDGFAFFRDFEKVSWQVCGDSRLIHIQIKKYRNFWFAHLFEMRYKRPIVCHKSVLQVLLDALFKL